MREHLAKELTKAQAEIDRIRQFEVRTPLNHEQFLQCTIMLHKKDVLAARNKEGAVVDVFKSIQEQMIHEVLVQLGVKGRYL